MTERSARPPDYHLSVQDKTDTSRKGRVGVAWLNGTRISIKLNPGVVLHWSDNVLISLFPNDQITPSKTQPKSTPLEDEDIPF